MFHAAGPHPKADRLQPHTGRNTSGVANNTTRLSGATYNALIDKRALTAEAIAVGFTTPFVIQATLIDALHRNREPPIYYGQPFSQPGKDRLSFGVVDQDFILAEARRLVPGRVSVPAILVLVIPKYLSCATVSITSDPPASETVPGKEVTVTIKVDASDGCDIPDELRDAFKMSVQGINLDFGRLGARKEFSPPSQTSAPSPHKPVHQPHTRSDKMPHHATTKPRTKRETGFASRDIELVFDTGNQATATFTGLIDPRRAHTRRQGLFASVQVIGIYSEQYPGIAGGVPGFFAQGNQLLFGTGGGDNPPPGPPPSVGSPVASIVLLPTKAYRHVHDPITVTAIALDANKAPIANASVVLAVYGDCDPWVSQTNYTTNAAGQAFFTIKSMKAGALSVVAAMVDRRGLPVVSYPSHIIYFNEHSYIDEREEQYYGSDHGDDEDKHGNDGHYGR